MRLRGVGCVSSNLTCPLRLIEELAGEHTPTPKASAKPSEDDDEICIIEPSTDPELQAAIAESLKVPSTVVSPSPSNKDSPNEARSSSKSSKRAHSHSQEDTAPKSVKINLDSDSRQESLSMEQGEATAAASSATEFSVSAARSPSSPIMIKQ